MAKQKSGQEWEQIARGIDDEKKEEIETLEDLEEKMSKTPRGMFVSGWDDPDDLVEEDKNPQGEFELLGCVSSC